MSIDDPLQKNIQRAVGISALRKIRTLVDAEDAHDVFKAKALRWLLSYGVLVMLGVALLLAKFLGVF
jgi:hypothetical protein